MVQWWTAGSGSVGQWVSVMLAVVVLGDGNVGQWELGSGGVGW